MYAPENLRPAKNPEFSRTPAQAQAEKDRAEKRAVFAGVLLHALVSRSDLLPDVALINTAFYLADEFMQKSGL